MGLSKIEIFFNALGKTYNELVGSGLIPDEPLLELYPGRDVLHMNIETGLSMSFWADSQVFKAFHIALVGDEIYGGSLPAPLMEATTKELMRAALGHPDESVGEIKLPSPIGQIGGRDMFFYHSPDKRIKTYVLYRLDGRVMNLDFALVDTPRRDHD